jgi:hypothetical protein
LNCAESEGSKRQTINSLRLLGSVIATVNKLKIIQNCLEVFRSNRRRRVAPSDPSLIKSIGRIQVVLPEMAKQTKTSINPNIRLNLKPRG